MARAQVRAFLFVHREESLAIASIENDRQPQ
jgi:hypothetical protein